jgi:hypothetical protein
MKIHEELSVFNRITFKEDTHSYFIDGEPTNMLSVTGLLKKFKKQFDKLAVAKKVAKKRHITVEELLSEWDDNNLYSTTLGTMLHKYIENYYCNIKEEYQGSFKHLGQEEKLKILNTLPTLIGYFHNFFKDNAHLECVKSEIILGDVNDTKICGTSDLLCYNTQSKEYEILDFKTNKKMENSVYSKLFYPFENMFEGQINEYTIQLNVYKYFIEKYTNIRLDKLKIVWFNSSNNNYKIFNIPDIQKTIKLMFNVVKSDSLFGK